MTNPTLNSKPAIGYSQLSDKQIIDQEHNSGAQHYGRIGLVVRRTEGCWLYDRDGKKYLDCLAA